MKRLTAICGAIVALAVTAVPVLAAPNPNVTGQPSQSCQSQPTGPPGLLSTTNGFARVAVIVYAGTPGTPSFANGAANAVSQYDVACYQVSQSH
jgi:hypothetical protein